MKEGLRIFFESTILVGLLALGGCGEQEPTAEEPNPRPVTVLELREVDPVKPLQLTGSVKSWNEQDIAFEVDGGVAWIVEQGANLEGRWKEDGTVRVEGDVLARLDTRPYTIARDTAAAAVDVAKQQLRTAEVQLDKVLPANLAAAEAEKVRAEAEYQRNKQAFDKNAIAEVDLIRARADRDAKTAMYQQAEATIDTKKAEIEALKAQVRQSEEQLEQAKYDLERCTLYAPFPGEVSDVYVESGGYVTRGQPVAHLVMMEPIKVDVAVSSETAAKLKLRDSVRLYLPGQKEPADGTVYEKATVADPETRTFRVSVITRNRRTMGGLGPADPRLSYPQITTYQPLMRMREGDEKSHFFVEENRALRSDGKGGYHVWAAPGHKFESSIDSENPVLTLRKSPVIPGERRRNYQGRYLFRELKDIGELEPRTLIALDVPDDFKDGGKVVVVRKQWLLRPGQLVKVLLSDSVPEPGLYLPMNAIQPIEQESGHIFIALEGTARKVRVKILDHVGELFRVEAADASQAELVAAGSRVITDHVHFLQDEERVKVIKTVELKL